MLDGGLFTRLYEYMLWQQLHLDAKMLMINLIEILMLTLSGGSRGECSRQPPPPPPPKKKKKLFDYVFFPILYAECLKIRL